MPTLLKKERGFSIVGVLVAAGMAGGLALYLANIARQQHVTQRKAETGTEITQLQHKILSVFYDGDACTKTLVLPAPHNRLANGRVIDELKNRQGTVVVKKGVPINQLLQVEQMVIRNAQTTGKTREADIVITMKKLGVANAGVTTVKTFKITAEMESATSNVISRCHHTLDAKEHGIKTRMCTEMGGVMVCPNGQPPTLVNGVPTCPSGVTITRCSVDNLYKKFCEEMGGGYTDHPSMKCDLTLAPVLQNLCSSMGGNWNSGSCDIASVYVNITGDSMSGALNGCTINNGALTCPGDISGANITGSGNIVAGGDMSAANVNASGKVTAGGPAPVIPQPTQPVAANCPSDYKDKPCYAVCAVDPSSCGGCSCGPAISCHILKDTIVQGTKTCRKCVISTKCGNTPPAGYSGGNNYEHKTHSWLPKVKNHWPETYPPYWINRGWP